MPDQINQNTTSAVIARAAVNAVNEVSPKTTAVQQSASLQGAGDLDYLAPVFSAKISPLDVLLGEAIDNDLVARVERLHEEQAQIRQENLMRLVRQEAQRAVDANERAAKLERDLANLHGKYRSLCSLASVTTVGCVVLLILQFR